MQRGTQVFSRDGKEVGQTTGSTHRCQMAGCTGRRITVKWPDGKVTHPCSKGMGTQPDGSLKIG